MNISNCYANKKISMIFINLYIYTLQGLMLL